MQIPAIEVNLDSAFPVRFLLVQNIMSNFFYIMQYLLDFVQKCFRVEYSKLNKTLITLDDSKLCSINVV